MLNSFPIAILAGTILGFLAGLGVGGGSLLILWLTMVLGMEQAVASRINLLFFLPAAIVSSCFRWKQGTLNIKSILPAVATGCIASVIGAKLTALAEPVLLKKLFGCLLVVTAVKELFYKKSRNR